MPRGVYPRKPRPPRIVIDKTALREMIECGYTESDAAKEFGCCKRWVAKVAHSYGMRFPRRGNLDPYVRLEIVAAIRHGRTTAPQIAEEVGLGRCEVYRLVKDMIKEKILHRVKIKGVRIMHLEVARWWGKE